MNDPTLNQVLQWGIRNSGAARNDPSAPPPQPLSDAERAALTKFLGGGKRGLSDAERMVQCMEAVRDNTTTTEEKCGALELFEELIAQLDNANNIESLKIPIGNEENNEEEKKKEQTPLWTVLIEQLENENDEIRKWAVQCCGVAVQNNVRTQERFLILGAIPTLVRMATADSAPDTRKAAVTALSSEIRNFQAALDIAMTHVPSDLKPQEKLDAADMDSVDLLISKLRANIPKSVS